MAHSSQARYRKTSAFLGNKLSTRPVAGQCGCVRSFGPSGKSSKAASDPTRLPRPQTQGRAFRRRSTEICRASSLCSHNHRVVLAGKDLWGLPSPALWCFIAREDSPMLTPKQSS